MKIFKNNDLWPVLKYPTGKKDGNKLGKRKKSMMINTAILVNNELHVSPSDYEKVKSAFDFGTKLPDISVVTMSTQAQSFIAMCPELKMEEEKKDFFQTYLSSFGTAIVRHPEMSIINPSSILA
jgi:hypothetical protein